MTVAVFLVGLAFAFGMGIQFQYYTSDRLIKLKTEDYALMVAVVVFLLSAYEGWLARRRDKIATNPHLRFDFIRGDKSLIIKLKNKGLGPARIKNIVVESGDRTFDLSLDVDFLALSMKSLLMIIGKKRFAQLKNYDIVCRNFTFNSGEMMGVNEEVTLIELKLNILSKEEARKFFSNETFKVTYENVYKDESEEVSKDSSWFLNAKVVPS